jgi:hypothetical protein
MEMMAGIIAIRLQHVKAGQIVVKPIGYAAVADGCGQSSLMPAANPKRRASFYQEGPLDA